MDKKELTTLIWNELRQIACATKLSAHRIVMVHESDIKKLVDKLDEQINFNSK